MLCQRISKLYKIVPYVPNMWNTYVLTASNLPHGFFFFSFLLTLMASQSRSCPLCSALCFSASSGIDSFLLILFLITWFSFFHLIIFSGFLFYFIYLFIYFFGFISDSLFIFLALSQVLRSVTSLVSGNFYQLLVYNSILVYLWFCICYGFDL